jgi:hypothetical protein
MPSELRDQVVEILEGEAGVTHVVLHRDAALDPKGDEITADIARESANNVVDDFTALGLKRRGAITLDVVDTMLSIAAYRAEKEADGDPADAIIWEELARPKHNRVDPTSTGCRRGSTGRRSTTTSPANSRTRAWGNGANHLQQSAGARDVLDGERSSASCVR